MCVQSYVTILWWNYVELKVSEETTQWSFTSTAMVLPCSLSAAILNFDWKLGTLQLREIITREGRESWETIHSILIEIMQQQIKTRRFGRSFQTRLKEELSCTGTGTSTKLVCGIKYLWVINSQSSVLRRWDSTRFQSCVFCKRTHLVGQLHNHCCIFCFSKELQLGKD